MTPNAIRAELLRRGIRQADIARVLGITRNAVWRVVDGRSKSRRVRLTISAAVDLPIAVLWPDAPVHKSTTGKRAGNG